MWEFIKVVKWLVAIGVFAGLLLNVFYVVGMISGAISLFYSAFCYIGVSGWAISSVVSLTSGLIYSFLVIFLYRTFYGS